MAENHCPDCGAQVTGGRDGCHALIDEMMAQAHADVRYAAAYRLAFDAYCLQHPDKYCVSKKSYVAHLIGLCHGLEHHGNPATYWAIPQWLNKPRTLDRPSPPPTRGNMTVADAHGASSPEEHARRVRRWAESVWRAYQPQHELARRWLQQALKAR